METGRHGEIDIRVEPAVLVGVQLGGNDNDFRASLEELRALAETAGVRVVGILEQRRAAPRGKTYIGKGKVEELAAMCRELGAKVVVFDNELAPTQVAELTRPPACARCGRTWGR
jgi:GTP-binding protein HflX